MTTHHAHQKNVLDLIKTISDDLDSTVIQNLV